MAFIRRQDMIDASKAGLAFYEKAFSPFQFKQYRILEFPRYQARFQVSSRAFDHVPSTDFSRF